MQPSGPEPISPDGSPVGFYRRLAPGYTLELVAGALPAGASVLDLGCGVGRIADPLAERGHTVVGVDEEPAMLAEVRHAETVRADITTLDLLPRRFEAVLLLSHLVNHGDARTARAMLTACRRHVTDGGIVIVEHLDSAWVPTVLDGVRLETGGVRISLRDVRHRGGRFIATAVYEADGCTWTQPFDTRVLGDERLDTMLAEAGLRRSRRLDSSMLVAVRAD